MSHVFSPHCAVFHSHGHTVCLGFHRCLPVTTGRCVSVPSPDRCVPASQTLQGSVQGQPCVCGPFCNPPPRGRPHSVMLLIASQHSSRTLCVGCPHLTSSSSPLLPPPTAWRPWSPPLCTGLRDASAAADTCPPSRPGREQGCPRAGLLQPHMGHCGGRKPPRGARSPEPCHGSRSHPLGDAAMGTEKGPTQASQRRDSVTWPWPRGQGGVWGGARFGF